MRKEHAQSGLARILLGGIRFANGTVGLLAPEVFVRRLDPGHEPSPAALYAFRLFGIRTVLLGLELFLRPGVQRRRSLRRGVLIHASDAVAAGLLGVQGRVPVRTAAAVALISIINVLLAFRAMGSD